MQLRIPIGSRIDLTIAREAASDLAVRCGFGELATDRLAQAALEAADGILRHAGAGMLYLRALQEEVTGAAAPQVELLAVDLPDGHHDADRGDHADYRSLHAGPAPTPALGPPPAWPRPGSSSGGGRPAWTDRDRYRDFHDDGPGGLHGDLDDHYRAGAGLPGPHGDRGPGSDPSAQDRLAPLSGLGTALDLYADAAGAVIRLALSPADRPTSVVLPPVSVGLVWSCAEPAQGGFGLHSTPRTSSLVLGMGRAAEAARRIASLQGFAAQLQQIDRMQAALTEGDDTAIAAVQIEPTPGQIRVAGAGCFEAWLIGTRPGNAANGPAASPHPVVRGMPPVVQGERRHPARAMLDWPPNTMLVLHGGPPSAIEQWQQWATRRRSLLDHHPSVVAAVLHRDRRAIKAGGCVVVCARSDECRASAPPELLVLPPADVDSDAEAAPMAAHDSASPELSSIESGGGSGGELPDESAKAGTATARQGRRRPPGARKTATGSRGADASGAPGGSSRPRRRGRPPSSAGPRAGS